MVCHKSILIIMSFSSLIMSFSSSPLWLWTGWSLSSSGFDTVPIGMQWALVASSRPVQLQSLIQPSSPPVLGHHFSYFHTTHFHSTYCHTPSTHSPPCHHSWWSNLWTCHNPPPRLSNHWKTLEGLCGAGRRHLSPILQQESTSILFNAVPIISIQQLPII